MFLQKLKLVSLAVGVIASAALAAGLFASQPAPADPPPVRAAAAQPPAPKAAPLPKGPNKILIYRGGRLVLLDPDGKNVTPLTATGPYTNATLDAKLSPDGTAVAFVAQVVMAGEGRAKRSLFVRTVHTKEEPADLKVDCETVYWSADGSELLAAQVNSRREGPAFDHTIVNPRTGKATRVRLPAEHVVTGWLADGRFVTSQLSGTPAAPKARICLMNRDGTESKAVTEPSAVAGGVPSPDGKLLLARRSVFKATDDGRVVVNGDELVLLDVATGRVTPIEGVPNGDIQGCCWSPDGRRIAYTWRQTHTGTDEERGRKLTVWRLVVADPDGKNPRTILAEVGPGQWILALGTPDWR